MYINEAFKTKKPRDPSHLLESKNGDVLEKKLTQLSNQGNLAKSSQEKIQTYFKEASNDGASVAERTCSTTRNQGDKQHPEAPPSSSTSANNHHHHHQNKENLSTSCIRPHTTTKEDRPRNVDETSRLTCNDTLSLSTRKDNSQHSLIAKYDKSVLPECLSFLLDVLQGLENAWILLRSRRQLVLFRRVQPIVQKTLRRRLTYEHVCQIANLCPELLKLKKWKDAQDDVELDLCDVSHEILQEKTSSPKTCIVARRIFLHRKLVEAFEQGKFPLNASDPCEESFQRDNTANSCMKRSIENVEEKEESSWRKTFKLAEDTFHGPPTEPSCKDSAISEKLLKKVRERELRETHQISVREKQREQIVWSRLPKLADAIRSIFASSKKTVLPFQLLLKQLKDQEMILFSDEELSEQIHEIGRKIPQWLQVEENQRNVKLVKLNTRMNYFPLRKQLMTTTSSN